MNWTRKGLKQQLDRAKQLDVNGHNIFHLLQVAAEARSVPLAFVLAVASRETGIKNIAGDGGHGRGVIQIDDRFHDIARRTDFKKYPEVLIDYGVQMLSDNINWARNNWPKYDAFKIAASAYNAGRGGAKAGVLLGNSDKRTAGGDYGRDILERQKVFEELLKS